MCKKYLLFTLLSLSYTCSVEAGYMGYFFNNKKKYTYERPSFTKEVSNHPFLWIGSATLLEGVSISLFHAYDAFESYGYLPEFKRVKAQANSTLIICHVLISGFLCCLSAMVSRFWKQDDFLPSFQERLYRSFRFFISWGFYF